MQTIGERLEERKRKGISIREASESTKIRSDYLQKFESNTFEIGLPDIYVRGFLRSYAHFQAQRREDPHRLRRSRPRRPRESRRHQDQQRETRGGSTLEAPKAASTAHLH